MTTTESGLPAKWPEVASVVGVSLLGLLVLPSAISHLFQFDEPFTGMIFSLITAGTALALVYGGYWLQQSGLSADQYPLVALWTLTGMLMLGAVLLLMVLYQLAAGAEIRKVSFFVTGTLTVGAAGGFLIGVYDAHRVRAERLVREQEKVALTNQMLRHNILNAANLVQGQAQLLEPHVSSDGQKHRDNLLNWTENITELTRKVRTIVEEVNSSGRETEPTDLAKVLESELAELSGTYEDVTVTFDGELPSNLHVEADEMLPEVFENVLTNAVKHNTDADAPEVRVSLTRTDESALISVADNGPGVPDDLKDDVFGRDYKDLDSTGIGVGLYLVNEIVDQYGGDVWVEDNEPVGSVFKVELRSAEGASV